MYDAIDLESSYYNIFELLWYSQLPCFDVLNVTTKVQEDFGRKKLLYFVQWLLF